jgi:hypothetical protein
VVGQRKGPSGANAPPVNGIKKCLESLGEIRREGVQCLQLFCFVDFLGVPEVLHFPVRKHTLTTVVYFKFCQGLLLKYAVKFVM